MKIKDKLMHLKYRIKNRWHYMIKTQTTKLKNKGYSMYKLVDDYTRLSLIVVGLLLVITLLIVLLILSFTIM